jgi:peptidoglycan/xylan/chitin deacetylase (PgdA/CDA1 family)
MTWDQVRELRAMKFEIGGHTINHVDLGIEPLVTARREIFGCKERIEMEMGEPIELFAFPFGGKERIRQAVIDIVREAGFICCLSAHGGKVTSRSSPYHLPRIPVYHTMIENRMELDNFLTYYDGRMSINLLPRIRTQKPLDTHAQG